MSVSGRPLAYTLGTHATGMSRGRYNQLSAVLDISRPTYIDFERQWRTAVGMQSDLYRAIKSAIGSPSVR